MGIEAEVVKVKDIETIIRYRVLTTPALVVNGEVKAVGKIPKIEEIKEWVKKKEAPSSER